MKLQGSCHCRAVRFRVDAPEPYPFMLCYCTICRKTGGGGGYAINLGARQASLTVSGEQHISKYRARVEQGDGHVEESPGERSFCARCGSALWVWDPRWPELVHPFASAIDTDLPKPPERTHLMLGSKASWVEPSCGPRDQSFDAYPEESLAAWHARHGFAE